MRAHHTTGLGYDDEFPFSINMQNENRIVRDGRLMAMDRIANGQHYAPDDATAKTLTLAGPHLSVSVQARQSRRSPSSLPTLAHVSDHQLYSPFNPAKHT
jgi:hypothetical protein